MEVDNDEEDQHSCKQICHIGETLPVESLTQGTNPIRSSNSKMEQSNYSSFKFSTTPGIDGCGTKCFPDTAFTENIINLEL